MSNVKNRYLNALFLCVMPFYALAYQLPQAQGVIGLCNNYANKASGDFIRDNKVGFNKSGGSGDAEFNLMIFYSSVSAACNVAHTMALHGTPAPQAIPMAAGSLKSSILSISPTMTEEDADRLLYPAAIYGYSL
ncbi:TPA: hypothetical protein RSS19_005297 [Klebsiella pneumoniae]|nr:hypothetical protein [Klebsiella pneumoniae]